MDARWRGGLVLALLLALAVALVAHGSVDPDPAANTFPGSHEVVADPGAHVGERVAVSGTVVGTDPVVVRLEDGVGVHRVTVTGLPSADLEAGDHLSVFGTLTGPGTVVAERSVAREPWELDYMYAVSFLGGLLVLWRLIRGWQLDRERVALVPRAAQTSIAPSAGPTPTAGGGSPGPSRAASPKASTSEPSSGPGEDPDGGNGGA